MPLYLYILEEDKDTYFLKLEMCVRSHFTDFNESINDLMEMTKRHTISYQNLSEHYYGHTLIYGIGLSYYDQAITKQLKELCEYAKEHNSTIYVTSK